MRSNFGDIENMKKTIYAILFYISSSQKNNWHDQCPDGEKSYETRTYIPPEVVCRMSSYITAFHALWNNRLRKTQYTVH